MFEYEKYVKLVTEKCIEEAGGGNLRQAAKRMNIDPAILSKIRTGKYIPEPKTFNKIFGTNVCAKLYIEKEEKDAMEELKKFPFDEKSLIERQMKILQNRLKEIDQK